MPILIFLQATLLSTLIDCQWSLTSRSFTSSTPLHTYFLHTTQLLDHSQFCFFTNHQLFKHSKANSIFSAILNIKFSKPTSFKLTHTTMYKSRHTSLSDMLLIYWITLMALNLFQSAILFDKIVLDDQWD